MCNVVAPTSSSSTTSTPTSPTDITSSSTPTPTPEVLFPLWSSTKYGSVSSTNLLLFVCLMIQLVLGSAIHIKNSNINSFVVAI